MVREGLTNAIKHAPESDVLVRVAVRAHALHTGPQNGDGWRVHDLLPLVQTRRRHTSRG